MAETQSSNTTKKKKKKNSINSKYSSNLNTQNKEMQGQRLSYTLTLLMPIAAKKKMCCLTLKGYPNFHFDNEPPGVLI